VNNFIEIAEGLIGTGKHKEAIDLATKAIDANPHNSEAYNYRGVAQYMLLNIDEAFDDLNNAIKLDDENHKAYSDRATIYTNKQEYDLAIKDLGTATEIAPENNYYKNCLARLHLIKKEYTSSLEFSNNVLNKVPLDFFALLYKADALTCLKEYRESANCYRMLLTNYQGDAIIYNNLGFCEIYTNELQLSKEHFEKAIVYDVGFAYPYDNLGYVYYLEKDYANALELINTSIELDASNSWAFKNRALVYLATGKKQEAKEDLLLSLELGYTKDYDDEVNEILRNEFNIR
jgi:tetratricopeptide (TPR) repeat protein